MVKHTLKIVKYLLQDFYRVFEILWILDFNGLTVYRAWFPLKSHTYLNLQFLSPSLCKHV